MASELPDTIDIITRVTKSCRAWKAAMVEKSSKLILAAVAFHVGICAVSSEEAVDYSGRKHPGCLHQVKDAWLFQSDQAKRISLAELSHVRFDGKATPLSRAPLRQMLVLPSQQHIHGTLNLIDEKKVAFVTSWGQAVSLGREQLVGIEQADDALPVVHDDFETSLKSWRIEGKAGLSREQAFFGKSSLLLDQAGQRAALEWQTLVRDGTLRLFFHAPAPAGNLRWTLEIIPETGREPRPALVIDHTGYACVNMKERFRPWKAVSGWHLLAMEIEAGRLRIFVDDHCLGQTSLPAKEAIKGIRIAVSTGDAPEQKNGKLWIDELLVTRRLPTMPRPQTMKDQDMLWLEHGEQLFGRIVSADAVTVALEAKFGTRSMAWSQLRGIYFACPKAGPMSADSEITFRAAPGFPVDSLRAKLLRWNDGRLIVRHDMFGEIAIERERLDKIRFAVK
jgi:hypothetical protein